MLEAKIQQIDLGNLKYGVPHEFTFDLKNTGKSDVVVERLVLGCNACTTARMLAKVIKPGDEAKVEVTFTPGSTGNNNKSVSVVYNKDTVLKLKFKALVEK